MNENVRNILYDSYNVSYVLENDRSDICVRIYFIQRFHVFVNYTQDLCISFTK